MTMSLFPSFILYLCVFLMFCHLIYTKISSNRIIIDHITCIYFGFMYYMFLPIILMVTENYHLFQNLTPINQFNSLSLQQIESTLLVFLAFILAIIVADLNSKNTTKQKSHHQESRNFGAEVILIATTILIIPSLLDMIPLIFSGYDTSLWVRGSRGPFLSYIVILITLSSLYLSAKRRINLLNLLNIFTVFAFIFSLLNLFTGNRGFLITFLISIVVIFSEFNKGVRFKNLLILVSIGIIISALVATFRSTGISAEQFVNIRVIIIAQFLAEGMNVANSLFIYIGQYSPNLIEFPSSFLSQFINLIPSFLLPSKFEYISLDPRVTYYLSSSNFYVILVTNFGVIGSILFMYFFTKFLGFVKNSTKINGIYPALCAHIPFMFFRDFDLTIVKYMFEFTILVGLGAMLFNYIIKKIA